MGGEELQRDRASEFGVLGFVDDTHPSLTELFGDFVVGDGFVDHGGPVVPWGLQWLIAGCEVGCRLLSDGVAFAWSPLVEYSSVVRQ